MLLFNRETRRRLCRLLRSRRFLFIGFVLLVVLYVSFNVRNYGLYTGNHPFFPVPACRYLTTDERDKLVTLAYNVHEVFHELGIDHWLMYGSIFGALRENAPLPWDDDVDIGFRGDAKFSQMDLRDFISAFESKGFKVYHKRWVTSNVMKLYKPDLPGVKVDIFAFYNYRGWMKRAGLETWVFALNYNLHDTFPARLVERPLPETRFGSYKMPVPREGIEMQKYLYPHDWWKVVKPVSCNNPAG